MNQSLLTLAGEAKSILILLPSTPHFDQVAAGLSLMLAFKKDEQNRKDVTIMCSSPMLVEMNRLVGVDNITSELGNKNLIIRFVNYPVLNLEKVSYEIENQEINIKVEPKTGSMAPSKDQVDLSYSGIAADIVFLIGGAHEAHFPALSKKEVSHARLVHIGVRPLTLPEPMELISLASPAASISEIVANLLRQNGYEIDGDIATNLVMGIEEGSKGFTSSEVNADTFALISELMRKGGKRFTKFDRPDRKQFPPGSIPRQPFFKSPPKSATAKSPEEEVIREEQKEDIPQGWLEPKIYKGSGTPIS